MKDVKGLTLLELLLALAISAVLLSAAVPSFTDTLNKQSLQSAQERLYSDLNFARAEAIARGRSVFICGMRGDSSQCLERKGDWSKGWLIFNDVDGNRQFQPEIDELLRESILSNSRIFLDYNSHQIGFSERGFLVAGDFGGTFRLSAIDGSTQITLVIYKTGRLSIR